MLQERSLSNADASWSYQLLSCIQEMAAQQTNAVLLMLEDGDEMLTDCRYPEQGIIFGEGRWRAFYHIHADRQGEHGHFHIFTARDDDAADCWSHVVGLSINCDGQPLAWFTVNRWVTDGPWLETEDFIRQCEIADTDTVFDADETLLGRWLLALMKTYQSDLIELYRSRDVCVRSFAKDGDIESVLEDRDVYHLGICQIVMQKKLEQQLYN